MNNKVSSIIKRIWNKVRSYFPSPLPVGLTEFNKWADEVIELANSPNNDSFKFALATMVINLKPTQDRVSKRYFVKSCRKGMASQVASQVMWELKEKQKAEEAKRQAEALKNIAETTGSPALPVVSNGPKE